MGSLSEPLKHRVRTFLSENGATPQSSFSRNGRRIFTLLQRRRTDDAFWAPLTELMHDLVKSVVEGDRSLSSRPEVALLAMWDVSELAALLRRALPSEPLADNEAAPGNAATGWQHFRRSVCPHAFGLLLLLSLAASACDSAPQHDGTTAMGGAATKGGASSTAGSRATGGTNSDVGGANATGGQSSAMGGASSTGNCQYDAGQAAQGHPLPPECCTDTALELWSVIQESTLPTETKQALYTCFASLNASWCSGLVELFRTASAQEIADYLSTVVMCCSSPLGTGASDFADARQRIIDGALCFVPIYKGITFPSAPRLECICNGCRAHCGACSCRTASNRALPEWHTRDGAWP